MTELREGRQIASLGVRSGRTVEAEWEIRAGANGSYTVEQATAAVLMDMRADVRVIRNVAIFFAVVIGVGLGLGIAYALTRLGG